MRNLYRSRKNRIIAGVCGGLGEYFNIDPIIVRILWVLFSLFGGGGIIAYIVAWLLIPDAKTKLSIVEELSEGKRKHENTNDVGMMFGLFLIFLGFTFLMNNLGFWFFSWGNTWPVFIIILGVIIILSGRRK